MDWISSFFVEMIALCDICVSVLFYIPVLITLIANRWLFGVHLCYISGYFLRNVPTVYEMWIIMIMSVFRLWMLKKTKAARERINKNTVRIGFIVLFLWSFGLSIGLMKENYAIFTKYFFNCTPSSFLMVEPTTLSNLVAIIWVALPMITIIVTNIIIVYIVVQQSRKIGRGALENKKTVTIILLVTGVFIFSYFPIIFKLIASKFNTWETPDWYYILVAEFAGLNIIANPIIYTVKSKRLRKFLKKILHLATLNKISTSMGEASSAKIVPNPSFVHAEEGGKGPGVLANGTVVSELMELNE